MFATKIKAFGLLTLSAIVLTLLSSCSEGKETTTPTVESTSSLNQGEAPTWGRADLEVEKLNGQEIYIYDVTRDGEKPPFYNGSMPLRFSVGYPPGGPPGFAYSQERPLFHDFDDFVNLFIYRGPVIVGAQTYDKENHLLAEISNIHYFVKEGNKQGMEIEEVHYGPNGQIVFKCTSEIDYYAGIKISEREKVGKKLREYYFIWPSGY